MNQAEAQKVAAVAPFNYTATENKADSKSKWQVDTGKLRVFLEHNLKGEKETEIVYTLYNVKDMEGKILYQFYALDDKTANHNYNMWLNKKGVLRDTFILQKTQNYEYVRQWINVTNPLVNEVGAYHLLSFVDPIFSQVGYLSKLDKDEIKDMMWDDVIVPLVISMIQNHEAYGITKGSRDEILALFDSMCNLVLSASEEGFTAKGMREAVKEMISTKEEGKGRMLKWF